MKNFKKLLALLLAAVMIFAIGATAAFAEDEPAGDDPVGGETPTDPEDDTPAAGTITVENAVDGQTYKAYKIFDVTLTGTGDDVKAAYTIDSDWVSFFIGNNAPGAAYLLTAQPEGGSLNSLTYNGSTYYINITEDNVAAFAACLIENIGSISADASAAASKGTAVIDVSEKGLGYYLVDSSVGALCALDTTDDYFVITEKNSVPEVAKTVKEGTEYGEENDAKIGDTVEFKSEITIPVGTVGLVYHDEMDAGLTLNTNSITVDAGNGNYTITTSGLTDDCDFEVSFASAYLAGLTEAATVTITYTAVLNAGAVVAGDGNENTAMLKYGDNSNIESTPSTTTTYTWKFDVFKYTGEDTPLAGAGFTLYTDSNCTTAVTLKADNGTFRVAVSTDTGTQTEIVTDSTGKFNISGLDSGKYYLKETKIPNGYNGLTEPVTVVISNKGVVTDATDGVVEIENNSGTVLPSTGGTGTVIFITVGAVLLIAAGIVLTAKKRMYNAG